MTVYIDGTAVGTTIADWAGKVNFEVPDSTGVGEHQVQATDTDVYGNVSQTSNDVPLLVAPRAADVCRPCQHACHGGAWRLGRERRAIRNSASASGTYEPACLE